MNVPQPIRYESDLLLFKCRADTTAAKVTDDHDVLHLDRREPRRLRGARECAHTHQSKVRQREAKRKAECVPKDEET